MKQFIWQAAAVLLAVFVFYGASTGAFALQQEFIGEEEKREESETEENGKEEEKPEPALTARVLHTARWEENRISANAFYEEKGMPEKKRQQQVFWSGETFLLQAEGTGEEPPAFLTAEIEGTPYKTRMLRRDGRYEGELFDKEMLFLWGAPEPETLTFVFTGDFGGTTLIERQTVTVDDREPYWLLHRKECKSWTEEKE